MEIEGLEGLAGTDLIQDTFLFRFLNFNETLALAGLCLRERRKKGDVIIEEGALGQALYLLEKGEVKVYKGEGKNREELAVLGRGELFGEMSLVEDELTSASVVAAGEVELLVIQRSDFEALLAKDKELALKVYKTFCNILSDRLRRTSSELTLLKQKHSPPEPAGREGRKAPAKSSGKKSGKRPGKAAR